MTSEPEEGAWPTPEQWLNLFLRAPREQQLQMAESVMRHAEESHRCLIENHEGAREYARNHSCSATYRKGWHDATHYLTAQLDAKDARDRARNDH